LFAEKQKYMYSVFERTLQTDEGKVIVRSHDSDRNAQLIYSKFLQVMMQSTEALMDSGELLSYLTTAKISDGSWRGTTKAFVLNWIDKLLLFHELTPVADRLSENTQQTLLQNAVIRLNALQQVQINSDLQKATHGTVLTFTQYRSLLINTATGYDKRTDKPNSAGKPRRLVFQSETLFVDNSDIDEDAIIEDESFEFDYDVDTTPAELQAYAMNRRERPQFKPGSRMPITRWKALSEKAKHIWDTMEDDDKALILALQENRKEASKPDQSKYAVNTHSLTNNTSSDGIEDALIAMVTKHSNRPTPVSHPGDIRKVLSQPNKTIKAQVQDHEISVNGHMYVRQASSHDVLYNVSQASRKKKNSLIDHGANGGIAGIDTRVIERHPHRTVDIRGIDNHEITSIPIVTAGAVARSQQGDVIVIMHQYAYHPQQGKSIHSSCQLESFANDVNDKSIHVPGGLQRIHTVDGYVFPLSIRDGLPYLGMRPYSDS
jgi:hypothetical protein